MDENNSKPFYRRNWFWITIFSIFIVVSATTYVANFSFYKGQADKATTSQSKSLTEKKKMEENPSLVAKYNSIKTGKKGFSKDAVVKLLDQPSSVQQLDAKNPIATLIWNGADGNQNVLIQITFEKNRAVSKSIQGLTIDRKKLLTLQDFDKLQSGDSYNKVINTLGDPDDYSDTNGVKTLTYNSDLLEADSTADALIKIEISNNKIIYTQQQNLK
ncbi:DUF3862 domain-containing protein [Companilactobacillus huachuanensis]|uniref:DUF3862 domain-containing protein n=1 Tax=Companilactobacillus huachuanensis TaxID=2559914 RepID=A0ABW1RLF3_9LACO|nr:DUF3862 domain-containing protein [Companilactobacillus huachuanensis]